MELREAFEAADTDKGGALEIDEVYSYPLFFLSSPKPLEESLGKA